MSKVPTRILLTGFGPFPGVPENASAAVVEQLAKAARELPDVRIVPAILPVDWQAAPKQVAALIAAERPDIALHFGVSSRAKGIVFETLAHNCCVAREDAYGQLPASERILDDGVETLTSTLPATAIVSRLQEKALPAELSEDAGAYLCNTVLYVALDACGALGARAGFIHLPVDLSGAEGGLTLYGAVEGGLAIIAACLESDLTS